MENLVTQHQLTPFYKNKKVFVTGHTGFKGAWLLSLLQQLGAVVKGYALEPDYEDCIYNMIRPLSFADSVIADIRNKQKLSSEIRSFSPEYIFHLAAQPLVRRSYEIPSETFEVNVIGTSNLLEAVRDVPGKCTIIIVTTDKVYENKEQDILYNEKDILGGYDPYSASKACTEIAVNSFRNSFFNTADYYRHQKTVVTARAGNVIGGGDWNKDRIIPDIIRALKNNQVIDVRNPAAVRPWQHVLEPLVGYLLLGGLLHQEPKSFSTAYNFGPHPIDHLTVKEVVETAIKTWGKGEWKDISISGQLHEAGLLKLDIQNAIKDLNWQPKLNAKKAIEWTVNWYKQPISSVVDFTFEQIKTYLAA